jgi:hypothetical protein
MNAVSSHRMFLKVFPNTFNPVMGGFLILQDHKPYGPFKEIVFKGHVFPLITATVTGTTGTFWKVTFKREGDEISNKVYSAVASLSALATAMATDFLAMGKISYNAAKGTVEIADPINAGLICTIARSTTAPLSVEAPQARSEPAKTKSEKKEPEPEEENGNAEEDTEGTKKRKRSKRAKDDDDE